MHRRRITTACAVLAVGVAALPATAGARNHKVKHGRMTYHGKTREGDPISFTVVGSQITKLAAYVPTLCLSTSGLPMSGTDPFNPPGSFPLGRTGKVTAQQPNAIWNTSDVTKNFEVTTKRDRAGRITGKLHVDYSFLELIWTYPMSSRPRVCTGDTTFKLAPPK
jgi:hypothetical protein